MATGNVHLKINVIRNGSDGEFQDCEVLETRFDPHHVCEVLETRFDPHHVCEADIFSNPGVEGIFYKPNFEDYVRYWFWSLKRQSMENILSDWKNTMEAKHNCIIHIREVDCGWNVGIMVIPLPLDGTYGT